MPARKKWSELSPGYKKRMQAKGLNGRNWNSKKADAIRREARGHAKTPERPEQSMRHPGKYPEYEKNQQNLTRQLITHKARLFGGRIKYRPRGSAANARQNPQTGRRPNPAFIRRFLKMTEADVIHVDWSNDEWGFLFYH